MNRSKIFKRALLLLAAVLGAFFLGRGLWVGAQGLSGNVQFDRQDWLRVILFVLAGLRLVLFARRRLQNGW
jgi:hypothetical protein